jgi:hypothetical protein
MKKICVLFVGLVLTFSADIYAQENKETSNTYIKLGFVHSQGSIEWAEYVINGFSIEVETYFKNDHLGLSGWSIGYRKDNLQYAEFGHLLSVDAFRTRSIKIADVKFGGGIEWGMPSDGFSHTRFNNRTDSNLSYDHVFLDKNSNIPKIGTKNDGALYPFARVSLVRRSKVFILEVGTRVNIMKFGIDEYNVSNDRLMVTSRNRRMAVPTVFISVGLGT